MTSIYDWEVWEVLSVWFILLFILLRITFFNTDLKKGNGVNNDKEKE